MGSERNLAAMHRKSCAGWLDWMFAVRTNRPDATAANSTDWRGTMRVPRDELLRPQKSSKVAPTRRKQSKLSDLFASGQALLRSNA